MLTKYLLVVEILPVSSRAFILFVGGFSSRKLRCILEKLFVKLCVSEFDEGLRTQTHLSNCQYQLEVI